MMMMIAAPHTASLVLHSRLGYFVPCYFWILSILGFSLLGQGCCPILVLIYPRIFYSWFEHLYTIVPSFICANVHTHT